MCSVIGVGGEVDGVCGGTEKVEVAVWAPGGEVRVEASAGVERMLVGFCEAVEILASAFCNRAAWVSLGVCGNAGTV